MKPILRFAMAGFAAVVLAGCAGLQLHKAEQAQPPHGTPFDVSLSNEYLDLARFEYQDGDYRSSDYFAIKSIEAGRGNLVLPTEMGERRIPERAVGDLSGARSRLMSALDLTARDKAPQDAARAQAMFDCWMEQQEEDRQPVHIARCRNGFLEAMAMVDAALAGVVDSYLVFFDFDSAQVTSEGMTIVRATASDAASAAFDRVVAVGHTDTAGSAAYNLGLSQRRADAVRSALVNLGVDAGNIQTVARGQTMPLIPTGDGCASRRTDASKYSWSADPGAI
ncbi:MAG: OmpA family protein [Rhodospirillales bacterium]|nr:MAG: OmpA family protein [Rhodospirillales bacterium]